MGPACAVADVRDGEAHDLHLDAEALLRRRMRRRTARTAARESARDLDVRHRLLWPQRPGRRHRRCRGAVEASRRAGARAIHAPRRHRLGSRRARPRSTAAAPVSTPPARSSPTRTSARRSRAWTSHTDESRAADVLAGHLLGLAAQAGAELRNPGRVLHVRPRAARLGDHPAADGSRLADAHDASARSLRPADPVRQRILHGRGGGSDQYRSGRFPAALSHASARPRRGADRGRTLRLGEAAVAAQRPEGQPMSRSGAASRFGGISPPSSRSSPRCGCIARPARSIPCAMSAPTMSA